MIRSTLTSELPAGQRSGPEFRRRVEWLMLLRLVITTLLLGSTIFFQFREAQSFFIDPTIPLYILVGATFLLSLIYTFSLPLIIDLWAFSLFQVFVDVLYTTILIYFTGGASSVFTLLYLFPLIASGLLHLRQGALFIASVTSILFGLLINLQFYRVLPATHWPWMSPWGTNTPGYILWVLVVHITMFFFVAVVTSSVAEQLRRVRVSLSIKESDYSRLSDLHTSIVRSISSGIITADASDRVTFINAAGAVLLGASFSDIIGVPLQSLLPVPEKSNGEIQDIQGETYRTVREVAGEKRHMDVTVSRLEGRDGNPAGLLAIFQDVTEMVRMEERVKLSEKQAAFMRIAGRMAHEIRNPLAALRGATELLGQVGSPQETEKRLLSIVLRESDRLNELLGDFLLTLMPHRSHKTRIILSDLVAETVDHFSRDPVLSKGVKLEAVIGKGVEVEGDSARLRQVLLDLLRNALEAVDDGGRIRVVLETDSSSNQALLRVEDSGSGIAEEIRGRIFEPFTTTKERGAGLGLWSVLGVVEAHDGTVEAESVPGSPTVLKVRLPLAPPEELSEGDRSHG